MGNKCNKLKQIAEGVSREERQSCEKYSDSLFVLITIKMSNLTKSV